MSHTAGQWTTENLLSISWHAADGAYSVTSLPVKRELISVFGRTGHCQVGFDHRLAQMLTSLWSMLFRKMVLKRSLGQYLKGPNVYCLGTDKYLWGTNMHPLGTQRCTFMKGPAPVTAFVKFSDIERVFLQLIRYFGKRLNAPYCIMKSWNLNY